MSNTSKIQICQNHLSEFYEAIKTGNLPLMDKIEHELTNEEKCVACAYVFKTQGTVREALEVFLNSEGFNVAVENPNQAVESEFLYWVIRLFIFSIVFFIVLFVAFVVKHFVFHNYFSFNIIEFVAIVLVTLLIFLLADDKFLD
jgi:hypothetical protein